MNYRLLFLATVTIFSLSAMTPDSKGIITFNEQKLSTYEFYELMGKKFPNTKIVDKKGSPLCTIREIKDDCLGSVLTGDFVYYPQKSTIFIGTTNTSVANQVKK